MFTGVVVESFAYVYQMPGGASLNREEMRELDDSTGRRTDESSAFQGLSKRSGQNSMLNVRAISSERISCASYQYV